MKCNRHDTRDGRQLRTGAQSSVTLAGANTNTQLLPGNGARIAVAITVHINSAAPTSAMRTRVGTIVNGVLVPWAELNGVEQSRYLRLEDVGDVLLGIITAQTTNAGDIVSITEVEYVPEEYR